MSFLFPSSTITFDAALRDLASGSPKARALAAHALGDVTEPASRRRALDALVRALDDDRPEVRAEACSSLGDLGEADALPPLVKRLGDGAAPVRQNAAIALGTLRLADGFEPLAEALRDGPADLRFQAATSLAEIDPTRAYDLLVVALGDRDPQVVGAAALALGAIGDARALEVLVPLATHADASARFDVAYALAELSSTAPPLGGAAGPGQARPVDDGAGRAALVAALNDEDRAWDAVTALGWLGDREAADALGKALTSKRTPLEAIVLAAGTLLTTGKASEADTAAAQRVLVAALTARKIHVRGLAIEQLAEVGGAWATAPLDKLARSGKGADFITQIAAALAKIGEREAAK
jgi:HEAT repeat protein